MPTLDLSIGRAGTALGGGAPAPVRPAAMLPALTSPGARYHAVYSNERLLGGYSGPLAYAALGESAAGGVDLGAGRERITAADLPAPVTPLYGWYDQSGGGRHLVQDVLAHRPRLRADVTVGGRLATAFAGLANDPAYASLSGPQSLIAGARCEALVIHPTTSLQNAVWSEHADAAGAVWRDLFVSLAADGALGVAQQTTSVHIPSVPQVLLLTEGPNGTTLFRDGVPVALRAGDSSALARLTLGASALGAQFNANFRLAAYLAIEGAMNAADAAAITAALQSRFAIRPAHDVNLVHIGDSIVEGVAASDTLALGAQLLPLLARSTRYWNLGIAGRTQAQCFATRTAREGALFEPGKVNLALIDAGINDLGAGARGADLCANTTRPYLAALRAMGFRVGLATLLPQTSGRYPTGDATIEQERLAYNAAARGDSAGADFLVDRAASPVMGRYPASCADAALYSATVGGAGLHPTTLGYALLAPIYADAINAAIT